MRQVMTESLALAGIGGAAGLMLGYFGRNLVPHLLSSAWEATPLNTGFDWRIFGFTAGVTVVTGVVFGLAPAWQAMQTEVNTGLKGAAAGATRRRKGLAGKALVVFQIALSMVLVAGAGLFTRTLVNLNRAELGFDPKGIVLFSIQAPVARYPAPMDVALHARLEERIARVPGVDAVTLTGEPMLANTMDDVDFLPVDQPKRHGTEMYVDTNTVGREFFSTYGIPILYGRGFGSTDTKNSPRVAVINAATARKFYPGENPVGRSFRDGDSPESQTYRIIGVSADAKYDQLRDAPPTTFYKLYEQEKEEPQMTYVVKTKGTAADVMPGIRAAVEEVDKDLPLRDIRTQVEQIDATILQERLFATLTAAFGGLALVLASIGIYGGRWGRGRGSFWGWCWGRARGWRALVWWWGLRARWGWRGWCGRCCMGWSRRTGGRWQGRGSCCWRWHWVRRSGRRAELRGSIQSRRCGMSSRLPLRRRLSGGGGLG